MAYLIANRYFITVMQIHAILAIVYQRSRLVNRMTYNYGRLCNKGLISTFWFKINPYLIDTRSKKYMSNYEFRGTTFKSSISVPSLLLFIHRTPYLLDPRFILFSYHTI